MAAMTRVSAWRLAALGALGAGAGLAFAWLTLTSDHVDERGLEAALGLVVGWSFIGTGLFAWWRRPGNRTGLLMMAAGFAWFATGVSASDNDLVFTIGIALDALFPALLGHLLLAFPSGRLETRAERTWSPASTWSPPSCRSRGSSSRSSERPAQPDDGGVEPGALRRFRRAAVPRGDRADGRRRSSRCGAAGTVAAAQRPAFAPVAWTGGATLAAFAVAKGFDAAGAPQEAIDQLAQLLFATVPFGFLAGLLRLAPRSGRRGVRADCPARRSTRRGALRAALAELLGDVQIAYWLPESERYVDASGRPFVLPERGWTAVELRGQRVAAIVHDPALDEEPELTRTAGSAAALALENQRLNAELRARIEELRASRARLVEAGDAERRRLEHDLHDGAQSRLVALALKLGTARRRAESNPEIAACSTSRAPS